VAIGLNQAIALQQLHWVLQNPTMGKVVDGRRYVYMSLSDRRQGHFPFWSEATIQRTFANLVQAGLVLARDDLNSLSFDRTKWYSVNLDKVRELEGSFDENGRIVEHRKMKNAHRKMKNASSQLEPTIPYTSLPETSSERSGATNAPLSPQANMPDVPVVVEARERVRPLLSGQNSGLQAESPSTELSERAFVRRFAPMIARVFERDEPVNEDKAVARALHRYHTDADWLEERLNALADGEGEIIRQKKGNAYWIRDQLQKEWAVYKQERDNATRRRTEEARYERECRAAIAAVTTGTDDVQGDRVGAVHLHGAIPGPGANSDEKVCAGRPVAVAGPGVVPVPGDGVGMRVVPQRTVVPTGAQEREGGMGDWQGKTVREMLRDYRAARRLETRNGSVSEPKAT
jgi:hypothetical protein